MKYVLAGQEGMEGTMNAAYILRTEKGFTLIELLISLSIFLLIVSIFPNMILTRTSGFYTDTISSQQVMTFFNQLAHDSRGSVQAEIKEGALYFTMSNNDRIKIELLATHQMRRTRNNEGHNLLLEGVKSFTCVTSTKRVVCEVVLLNGYQSKKSMLIPFERGGQK
ncbi:ComGF family competence protein [Alkalihalobacillus sp. MEB130]|uniref:ComGF family competence protein n=1 Tax=Alkalihalobacillus sp. MEB130 TaxID=2976704 RepID=UPI0028E08912|nr:ComGF family competence protein [Alkalihalobacillus sp. MEB130]MDT8863031.1 ComGF family competence protein [Alkalihalobacillus sp. MEB130]